MPVAGLVFSGVVAAFGILVLRDARNTRDRVLTATELHEHGEQLEDSGTGTTARGPVSVTAPGRPDRAPPAEVETTDGEPALWAWRVRSKHAKRRGGSAWRTSDSGLAIGEFSLRQDWEDITIDTDSLLDEEVGVLQGHTDPFEAPNCYLGEPKLDVLLGELDPINKLLERWGLTGDDGLLSELEITISSGRKTMTPDRYQATVIRDGDELLVQGELDETGDTPVLRGTENVPMLVAVGNLEKRAEQIKKQARRKAITGVGIIGFGCLVAAIAVL
ncbi:hypothetical protein AArcMg_4155 (plasmid) [Natrarchaeobaculum sulfurireducens]|uniref:Uncharacterized protein n=1 Tax=Natrarchaeobaculum sulfurireducens TaxID=2044521 RepID=A0A346PKD5_9EURY|nr:hypothetical protein AArc1_5091 [Natrarchaeobaculum sulfurireducens]AXR79980.1 hypothetical protein AArcMg_4155 [Natrarchaeobaculum sulfurireducens]